MGGKSAPAPAPAAAQPVLTTLPETKDQPQEIGARGAARRLDNLGQPSGVGTIETAGSGDPLGANRKQLAPDARASMLG